jgi:hypothetical protein
MSMKAVAAHSCSNPQGCHKPSRPRAIKQSSKDRLQAASEGAIHGTSSRKESDDALGHVVVQRAANGNDREECSHCYVWDWQKACMLIDGEKYTIEGCIPAYFHLWPNKTDLLTNISSFYVLRWYGLTDIGVEK